MTFPDKRVVAASVVVGLVLIGWLAMQRPPKPMPASSNIYTVKDETAKLTFNVSKNFEPIPKEELAGLNPGFNYGYRPQGDPATQCIVAESKLKGPGSITPPELRDGLLKEVKKVHPDVQIDNLATATNPAKFGEGQGILLQLSFKEGEVKTRRVEIIALGKSTQVVAYCQTPLTQVDKYYNDFTIFFSSLKLTS